MADEKLQSQPVVLESAKEILARMTLFDDELMSKAFEKNHPATQLLLKIILERNDIHIVSVKGQYNMKNPLQHGRSIILDIHAVDSADRHYNVEVQRKNSGANVRRARFHSSMQDARMLTAGQEAKELKDSYVIFITENDFFGLGLPVYHFDRIIRESLKPFSEGSPILYVNDGSHILYVNGSYIGDDPIGRLMHDFRTENPSDFYYKELADAVRYFKETQEGQHEMSDIVREYGERLAAEAAEKAAKEATEKAEKKARKAIAKATKRATQKAEKKRIDSLLHNINALMQKMSWTLDHAMSMLDISDQDQLVLRKLLA